MATRQSYAAEEAAGRVIPCVAPLAVDAVQEVRQSALSTLLVFVTTLQEHSSKLDSASGTPNAAAQQVRNCLGQDVRKGSGLLLGERQALPVLMAL